MSPEIIHSIILIITISLSFLFAKTPLAQYDLQISASLFIILFLAKRFIKTENRSRFLESIIFTLVILIIINSSGGLASPFFFLIYFLLFSLSLLLEPIISVTTTLTLVIFFLLSLPQNQDFKVFLPIFSLAFLTPFAMILGKQYQEVKNQKSKVKSLQSELGTTKEETFLFLSLMLKNHLKSIRQAAENFMGDHELHEIKKHERDMEKLIEKFENQ